MYVIYVSSLIRSVLSLHDLINNRISAKDIEIEKVKILREEEEEKKKKEEEMRKKVEEKKNSEDAKKEGAAELWSEVGPH